MSMENARAEGRRPTIADVDPSVLAVDSLSDETRVHGNADETDVVQSNSGDLIPATGPDGDTLVGRLDDGPTDNEPEQPAS